MSCRPSSSKKVTKGASLALKGSDRYLRWSESQLPLNIVISNDLADLFPSEDDDYFGNNPIEQMLDQWNISHSSLNFFNLPSTEVTNLEHLNLSDFRDNHIGIYKSDSWFSDINNNALAITQYFAERRNVGQESEYLELIHADIVINYRYYQFSIDKNVTNKYHLPSVVLHELGHLLGLSHQNDFDLDAVMSPYMSIVDSYEAVKSNDIVRIKNKYDDSIQAKLDGSELVLGALSNGDKVEGQIVRGLIELRPDGKCEHVQVHEPTSKKKL